MFALLFLLLSRGAAQCMVSDTKLTSLTGFAPREAVNGGNTYPTIQRNPSAALLYLCPTARSNTVLTVSVSNSANDAFALWVANGVNCDSVNNIAALAAGSPNTGADQIYPDGVGPNDGGFSALQPDPLLWLDFAPPETLKENIPNSVTYRSDVGGTDTFTFSMNNRDTLTDAPFCLWGACLLVSSDCALTVSVGVAAGPPLTPSATTTPSATGTPSGTGTPTGSDTVTPTPTGTPTGSDTPSPTGSTSVLNTVSASPTAAPSIGVTPSVSPTPTASQSLTGTGTSTYTMSTTATRSLTTTGTPTGTPTGTRTAPSPSPMGTSGATLRSDSLPWRAARVQKHYLLSSPSVTLTLTLSNFTGAALHAVFGCGSPICENPSSNFYNMSNWGLTPATTSKIIGSYSFPIPSTERAKSVVVPKFTCYAPNRVMCVAVQCDTPVTSGTPAPCAPFSYSLSAVPGAAATKSRFTRTQIVAGSLLLLLILLLLLCCLFKRVRVLLRIEGLFVRMGCSKQEKKAVAQPVTIVMGVGSGALPQANPHNAYNTSPQMNPAFGVAYGGAPAPAAAAAPSLPPGWQQESDETDTWYVNKVTGESSWTFPHR